MSSPFTCTKALSLLLALFVCLPAQAAKIETLLMPGKVIEGHAEKEQECNSCHARFSKETQDRLCLKCHDKIDADISDKRGYHGQSPQVAATACSSCHTDHKGRKAGIVLLERDLFDHEQTDYPLRGGHTRVECHSCHQKGEKWREAPDSCIACHRDTDVHKGKLGEQCADCHGSESWNKSEFDHDKTKFPLKGGHRETLCSGCHLNPHYEKTPKECVSCHRTDDVHRNGYKEKCDSCHNNEGWKKASFDHAATDFKLRGAHQKIGCVSCHRPGKPSDKTPTSCVSCHRGDDPHRGRNGERCQQCHSEREWGRSRFNHDKDTKFPLRGPHKEAGCTACHGGGVKKDAPVRQCSDCHKGEDIHDGELGNRCDNCHRVDSWQQTNRFDHDLSHFPLYGMHALASCESCHLKGRYASLQRECNDCHDNDDDHHGALGDSCGSCHNANGWMLWQFNHDNTDFSLEGAHQEVSCNSCHQEAPADKTPTACAACHQRDDAHLGRFGQQCQRCHDTTKFNVRPNQ